MLGVKYRDAKSQESQEQRCEDTQLQGLRTSSQFLQVGSDPTQFISDEAEFKVHRRGGSLGETFAIVSQVYRQRVTYLKSDEGSGDKDEKEQQRECKAESSAPIVAAAALPRWAKLHREKVCSYSILPPIGSSSPSSSTSRGSTRSPRSPTSFPTPSTTSSGAGSSRTRAMCVK